MLRLPNNIYFLLCVIFMSSCGFADLRQIRISIEPDNNDSVLPEPYSPVILKFNAEMLKNETEGILQISSDLGAVNGDKFWKGNDLYFVPVQGWTAGIRYTLSLAGTIHSEDGREMRIERFISFYAVNKNDPPLLEWHSPGNNASVGTNNILYEFHFSRSMDRLSVETALVLDGIGNKTFEWHSGDKILKVNPEKNLSPWTSYKWSIRDTAKSADGVPLPKTYSGNFITDLEQIPPKVKSIFPVINADGVWYPTGAFIENGLRSGQGIAVEFNKPMGENVLRSLRLEPSISGRTEFLTEESVVFILTKDPEPGMTYTLIISGDARDSEGIKTGADYKINFIPDIPLLEIYSITAGGNDFDIRCLAGNTIPVCVDPATGQINLSLYFSLLFDSEEMKNTPQKITLSPFFPGTLAPIALQYVNWTSGDRLLMRWEGLAAGNDYPHYYRLIIPGGKSGISSGPGIYMKENNIFYLEAVR